MTQVYFTASHQQWSSDELAHMLLPLPVEMQHKIMLYKSWQDRQSRILGKWMLLKLLQHFNTAQTLADIKYTPANKPYLEGDFDFSIAHSGAMVLCAGTLNSKVGIDIEYITPIHLPDHQEQLTAAEWKYIKARPYTTQAFYEIWTKKEALQKATGKGIYLDPHTLDVCGDRMAYNNENFFFYPLQIDADYMAHLAICPPCDAALIAVKHFSAYR
jgi:4'-phosphopantetheinyl transferase